jgi:hypothetical protein
MYLHTSITVPIRPAASRKNKLGRPLSMLALATAVLGGAAALTLLGFAGADQSGQEGNPAPVVQYLPEPSPQPGPSPMPPTEPNN